MADQIARWRGPFEEALFLCDLGDLCGKNVPMNANQSLHRTAAPRLVIGGARFIGRWFRNQCPSPAAVGELDRSAASARGLEEGQFGSGFRG